MVKSSLILLMVCISCNAQFNNKQDTYLILSLITNHLTKIEEAVAYPPKPLNSVTEENRLYVPISKMDSVNMDRNHLKVIDKQYIIAIDSILQPFYGNSKPNLPEDCLEFSSLFKNFIASKKESNINIENIKLERKDSLVVFLKEYENDNHNEYDFIDGRLSFSNIEFDNLYSKAIVQVSYSTSKLAGISVIYFIKKIDGQWQIIGEKGLSIS